MKLIVSRDAIRDLDDISRWTYETFGQRQAKNYVAKIEEACDRLVDGRERGRPADELALGMRRLRVESHFIYFRLQDDDLVVIRILHSRMDLTRHL